MTDIQLGKIIQGDCLEILPSIPDKSFDYTFTSPPYNRLKNDKYELFDDKNKNYFDFLQKTVSQCLRISKNYVFFNIMPNYDNRHDVYRLIGDFSDVIQQIIVWEKLNPQPAQLCSVTNAYEFFLVLGDKPIKSKFPNVRNHVKSNVNSAFNPKTHHAVMNRDIADWVFDCFIPDGSTILDPFMGYGTTGVIAEEHNCKWMGIEVIPAYIKGATERIETARNCKNLKFAFFQD